MNELASCLPEGGPARLICDAAWQSTAACLLALLALRWISRPAVRAWIALLGMGLALASPTVALLARAGGYGWLPPASAVAAPAMLPAEAVHPIVRDHPHSAASALEEMQADPHESPEALALSAGYADAEPRTAASGPPGAIPGANQPNWRSHFWRLAAGLWAAASLALAVRCLTDFFAVLRLRRAAQVCAGPRTLAAAQRAARVLGLRTAPRVAYSASVECPTVIAWGRPVVFLPPSLRESGRGADVRREEHWLAVLCHELGHVRRGDGWWVLAFEAAVIALPWQPLLWRLRREFLRACEEACDDWALFAGVDPVEYAAALADWIPLRGRSPLALGVRSRRLPIRRRIERVLGARPTSRPSLGRAWLFGGGGLAASLAAVLGLLQAGASRPLAGGETAGPAHEFLSRFAAAGSSSSDLATARDEATHSLMTSDSLDRPDAVLGDARLRHWHFARLLGFGAGGDSLLSAGRDGLVHIWSAATGRSRRALPSQHVAATLSGDGRLLFLATDAGEVEVRDAQTGRAIDSFRVAPQNGASFSLSLLAADRDGANLACGGRCGAAGTEESCLIVWDVARRRSRFTVRGAAEQLAGRPIGWKCLTLTEDGEALAAGGSHYIGYWELTAGRRMQTLAADYRVYALAFSPDGDALASGDAAGIVKIWSLARGDAEQRLELPGTIGAVAFSPDGRRLAAADPQSVHLWDVASGAPVWSSQPLGGRLHVQAGLRFREDGSLIAAAVENRIVLLNAGTGADHFRGASAEPEFTTAAAAPAAREFITGDAKGGLAVWSFATGRRIRAWRGHGAKIDALAVSRDGAVSASAAVDGTLAVWSTATGELRRLLPGYVVNHLALSPDGRTLAATGRRAEVSLWDLESGERRDVISRSETGLWHPFEFAAEGRSLFAGARPGCTLVQWDPAPRTVLRQIEVEPRNYPGLRIAIGPDGRYAAAGVYGGRFVICDLQAERQTTAVDGHLGRLESLAFSPRGLLASAAEDGRVCLWRAETARREATLTVGPPGGRIHKVVFGDDGRRLATVNGDGTVSIFTSPAS